MPRIRSPILFNPLRRLSSLQVEVYRLVSSVFSLENLEIKASTGLVQTAWSRVPMGLDMIGQECGSGQECLWKWEGLVRIPLEIHFYHSYKKSFTISSSFSYRGTRKNFLLKAFTIARAAPL